MLYDNLGYEQLRALQVMRDTPDKEASVIAKEADCSWAELFALADRGLAEKGMERLSPKRVHPTITDAGKAVVTAAEADGVLTPNTEPSGPPQAGPSGASR
jgi:hypothetical protein